MPKYTTSISDINNDHERIRGYDLQELMKTMTFTETIFLILSGEKPSESQTRMLDAMLVAAIDHGPGTASAQTARITASAKNSVHTSVAAGILAMGERHGSAIEGAARFFLQHKDTEDLKELLREFKEKKVRIPGFGHPFLEVDHRSSSLMDLAKELGVFGEHCKFALRTHKELNEISSKSLAFNIDGSMAAILLDMGFVPGLMKGFFIIARTPGLVAQVREEIVDDTGIRRVPVDQVEYQGPVRD